MIPVVAFAENGQYYKDWIEGECIQQSYMAQNDFIAKKIFNRCEKASTKCIRKARGKKVESFTIDTCKESQMKYETCVDYLHKNDKEDTYKACMLDEIGWKGDNTPNFN